MPVYSCLFLTEVKNLLTEKYDKIKMQVTGFNQDGGLVKEFMYTLVDESQKFHSAQFIRDEELLIYLWRLRHFGLASNPSFV